MVLWELISDPFRTTVEALDTRSKNANMITMTDHATVCYSYSALSDDNEHRKLPSSFTSLVSVAQGQRLRTLVGSSFTSAFTEKL